MNRKLAPVLLRAPRTSSFVPKLVVAVTLLSALAGAPLAATALADQPTVAAQLVQSRAQYADPNAWAGRRKELREEFLKGARLWPLPDRPPVKPIVHSRREYQGYSVENVALETLPGFFCTGNLYRPLGRRTATPAVLCPHGHFQPLGRMRENHQIRCAHFARLGATVFSYSMVGWQDSRQTTHDDPWVLALQTWNSICAVDFLTSLTEVDDRRIGVTGASGGGTQTLYLALIDTRIKVSAPLVIVYPWTAPEGCLCEGGLPVMQAAKTNTIELAAAVAPRPQLLISVGTDKTKNFPEFGFIFIRHMYQVAGAAHQAKNVHFAEEAHDFGKSKREAVYEFFAQHLQISGDPTTKDQAGRTNQSELPPENLQAIVIQRPEEMEVFNDQYPLPKHALHGSQAIQRALERHLHQLRDKASKVDAPSP